MPHDLASLAEHLALLCSPRWPDLAQRVERAAARHREHRFHIAVVGEFKRGKSTLVNALLDNDIMPTGVLPLTSVATEVGFGEPSATVTFLDDTHASIDVADLADYVTEARNPDNQRHVARVEVQLPVPLLAQGLVLIDTPGTGSTLAHNTEAALGAHRDADAAIVVVAADSPLSAAEHALLASFATRPTRPFIVVTKADRLTAAELEQVRDYITDACGVVGARVWAINARAAASGHGDRLEFDAFRAELDWFVTTDLAGARDATLRAVIEHAAADATERITLERRAAELGAATLETRAARLAVAVEAERSIFTAERLLLEDRCRTIAATLAADLAAFAREEPRRHQDAVTECASTAPLADLDDRLRDLVADEVRVGFDPELARQRNTVESAWNITTGRFQDVTQARVDAVRTAAGDLFDLRLEPVAIPRVRDQIDRFGYLFLPPMVMPLPFEHAARRLLPASVQRRRLGEQALRHLDDEYAKHAGRVRYAVTEQLNQARRQFVAAMDAQLEQVTRALVDAIGHARNRATAGTDEAARQTTELDRLAHAIADIVATVLPDSRSDS